MISLWTKLLVITLLVLLDATHGSEIFESRAPYATVYNHGPKYSLVNSVDFHPSENIFCVSYTHCDSVVVYKINAEGAPQMLQSLRNPSAKLNLPQHAAFSPDGKRLVVANWGDQTLSVFKKVAGELFEEAPVSIKVPSTSLTEHKPHGISFSPCGCYLAVAYGAASYHGKAVALFRMIEDNLELSHVLYGPHEIPGIPKGITFSPDGTCLLVTFSDANCIVIFDLSEDHGMIMHPPRQVVDGEESQLSRPEDVKIIPCVHYCAISKPFFFQNT